MELCLTQVERKVAHVCVDIGPCFPIARPKLRSERAELVLKLPIDRGTFLTLKPKDAANNPVSLDDIDGETIQVNTPNPELVSVELMPDQRIKIVPVGPLGSTQVNVSLQIPGIETPFTGFLDVQTVAGSVNSFTIEPGELFPV